MENHIIVTWQNAINIKNFIFSLQHMKMSGKNINFNDKKIKKSAFYKNKTTNSIKDIKLTIYQFLKKSHMAIKIQLNTLLDITIMMLLDCYV